jgi:hypothetical protein
MLGSNAIDGITYHCKAMLYKEGWGGGTGLRQEQEKEKEGKAERFYADIF